MEKKVTVFLDSNVLFSICWSGRASSRAAILYDLQDLGLLKLGISQLVEAEVRHNLRLKRPAALELLATLLAHTRVLEDVSYPGGRRELDALPEADRLILGTALAHRVDVFLTGNTSDFSLLLGRRVGRTLIATPRQFLERRG